jgi:hypothetical protein
MRGPILFMVKLSKSLKKTFTVSGCDSQGKVLCVTAKRITIQAAFIIFKGLISPKQNHNLTFLFKNNKI